MKLHQAHSEPSTSDINYLMLEELRAMRTALKELPAIKAELVELRKELKQRSTLPTPATPVRKREPQKRRPKTREEKKADNKNYILKKQLK